MRLAHSGSRALARERHDGHRNADAGRPQAGDHRRHDRHRRRRDGGHAGPAHREAVPRGVLRRRRLRGDARLQLPPRSRHRDGAGPGYKATSWEKGYGDFVLKPDMATMRRIPWLPGTALVLCDVLDHHTHEDVPHSPRAILKKQLARLDAMKLKAYVASELEFFLFDDSYDVGLPEGLSQPQDERVLHRGLPHPADDQGRRSDAGDPERAQRRRYSRRELQG